MRAASSSARGRRAKPSRLQLCRYDRLEVRELLAASLAVVQALPASGAVGLSPGVDPSLTFDRPLDPATLNAGTFVLRDAAGNLVPSTVSLDPNSNTVRLAPSVALEGMETFLATLSGGASGVNGLDGSALPGDFTWSFTTEDFANPGGPLGPGVLVNRTDGLITDAAGGTATFAVALSAPPSAPVTIPLHSGDPSVAVTQVTSLTFTPMDWDMPQSVTVAGAVNPSATAHVPYQVYAGPAVSADPSYNGYEAPPVSLTNQPVNTRQALEAASAAEAQRFAYNEMFGAAMHGMGTAMQAENDRVFALVPTGQATNRVIQSGNWSDPATWAGGVVPADGADVWVMPGRTVTVDGNVAANLHTVRVSGTLAFATDRNTSLHVDTVVVDPAGTYTMGTDAAPVGAAYAATVVFTDSGPIDRAWDPFGYSRGLISHGTASVVGAAKTGSVTLAKTPQAGDTQLVLATAPLNWKVGDVIDLPGTSGQADERFHLVAVSADGKALTLDAPVGYDLAPPQSAAEALSVADLTRNVVFTSANTLDTTRRGHVMFMHDPDVAVKYAAFVALGRTDFIQTIDNAMVDANGVLVPGTGTNPKGRYALHFHMTGTDGSRASVPVVGCVVDDATGWGFVNHSSNVMFLDDVAVHAGDAGFVTEAGDEIGAFRDDLAVGGGHVGFWLNGPGVQVLNNVASGFRASGGLNLYGEGFVEWDLTAFRPDGSPVYFAAANVPQVDGRVPFDPLAPAGMVRAELVPFHLVGNRVYNSWGGFMVQWHKGDLGPAYRSTVDGGAAWDVGRGLTFNYSTDVTFNGLSLRGTGQWYQSGVYGDLGPLDLAFNGVTVTDWGYGINFPAASSVAVSGGDFNNTVDFLIPTFDPGSALGLNSRTVTITGASFRDAPLPSLLKPSPNSTHYRMLLDPIFPGDQTAAERFLSDTITVDGRRVYYSDQAADAVVTGTGVAAYDGKTNAQLKAAYGVSTRGSLFASDGVVTDPRIFGGVLQAPASTVQWGVSTVTVAPRAWTVSLTITRTGDTASAATVSFTTVDGTALSGTNYQRTSGTVGFAAGQTSRTVTVRLLADLGRSAAKSFNIRLTRASGTRTSLGDLSVVAIVLPKQPPGGA